MDVRTKWSLAGLSALFMSVVLVFSAAVTLWFGTSVYHADKELTQDDYRTRTAIRYIATKLRQNDAAGGIAVEWLESATCLVLDDGDKVCRLYWDDGCLMEAYTYGDEHVTLGSGIQVLETDPICFLLQEGLLTLSTPDVSTCLSIRSEREVGA